MALGLRHLLGADVAQTEVANQALMLEFGKRGQWLFDRTLRRAGKSSDSQVDHIENFEPEVAKVVVDGVSQLLTRKRRRPRLIRSAAGANLGHDHQALGIGMQRLLNDLIGDMRAVVVAGIDVVHACGDGLAQNRSGGLKVTRRAIDLRTCQLHRSVSHAVDAHRRIWEGKSAAEIDRLCVHFFSYRLLMFGVESFVVEGGAWRSKHSLVRPVRVVG